MITKKVNRYYCEFCGKGGCSAGHMKKHESRCTLNPDRFCGMCGMRDLPQTDMDDMLAVLPDPKEYMVEDEFGGIGYSAEFGELVEKAMPKLRELTENCPACIMAALRIKGIPAPIADSFDYNKEREELMHEHNGKKLEEERRSDEWDVLYGDL